MCRWEYLVDGLSGVLGFTTVTMRLWRAWGEIMERAGALKSSGMGIDEMLRHAVDVEIPYHIVAQYVNENQWLAPMEHDMLCLSSASDNMSGRETPDSQNSNDVF